MRTRAQVSVGWGPAPPNLINLLLAVALAITSTVRAALDIMEYPVPAGSHPHDLAPALDGGVWYTAQHQGALGWLDPKTGKTRHIPLGNYSAPHGVIVGAGEGKEDGCPRLPEETL